MDGVLAVHGHKFMRSRAPSIARRLGMEITAFLAIRPGTSWSPIRSRSFQDH
jgi:hypothetical protein